MLYLETQTKCKNSGNYRGQGNGTDPATSRGTLRTKIPTGYQEDGQQVGTQLELTVTNTLYTGKETVKIKQEVR